MKKEETIQEARKLYEEGNKNISKAKDLLKSLTNDLDKEKTRYCINEFLCMKLRGVQIGRYIEKVVMILDGKDIKKVEETIPPYHMVNLVKDYKAKNKKAEEE